MIDALIIGAGPVGMATALGLARRGLSVRIVDQGQGPSIHSKALVVHSRSLEVLDAWDIAEDLVEHGKPLFAFNIYDGRRRLTHLTFNDVDWLDAPFPFMLMIPQRDTEQCLQKALARQGVRVEWATACSDIDAGSDNVRAVLDGPGGQEEVEAAWLVGCDGAHSTVRHALDMPFEGSAHPEWFVLADVTLDWMHAQDESHIYLSTEGALVVLPLVEPDTFRIIAPLPADDPDAEPPEVTLEMIQALLDARAGVEVQATDPRWLSRFRVHRRLVPDYRQGRVLLAGDAAHIHSPVGGQGMNLGLQDAANLCWKLALVHSGRAPDSLLDSYSPERRPLAAQTLWATSQATRVITLRATIPQKLRNHMAAALTQLEIVQNRMARRASMLTLSYRRSPIVDQHRGSILTTDFIGNPRTEDPSLKDWFDFGRGPAPGDRAPNVYHGDEARLCDLWSDSHHTLLLFDGAANTKAGYNALDALAVHIEDHYEGLIEPALVVWGDTRPAALSWPGRIILDADRAIHQRYGAGAECLYLIRPDGHVGYRSQPIDRGHFEAYLSRIFKTL